MLFFLITLGSDNAGLLVVVAGVFAVAVVEVDGLEFAVVVEVDGLESSIIGIDITFDGDLEEVVVFVVAGAVVEVVGPKSMIGIEITFDGVVEVVVAALATAIAFVVAVAAAAVVFAVASVSIMPFIKKNRQFFGAIHSIMNRFKSASIFVDRKLRFPA